MEPQKEKAPLPKVGLFARSSGGSNTGSLTGLAALEVVRRLGSETVGICSLPATQNDVPRQSALVSKIEKIVVIDGCHNECVRQLLAGVGIQPDVYLNLETEPNLTKQGPFSSLAFTDDPVKRVAQRIIGCVQHVLKSGNSL
ncbi:MAG: putative zinc-binding protein [bacterium]|jgi:uncharacterized metal-binding protein|nr:putative zinc-binding protein [candidate division KSB1 bacterium]MDH7560950.1 putative zinc-binding protein [bacterium]